MKQIAIFILFILFTNCGSTKSMKYVTIIGEARNAKAGAYIISNEDGLAYDVEDLRYWDDDISSWTKEGINKQVKVSGYLKIIKTKKITGTQQAIGTKRIISKASWVVVSNDSISDKD